MVVSRFMNPIQTSCALTDLIKSGRTILMSCEPEVVDFTSQASCVLLFRGAGKEVQVPFSTETYRHVTGLLMETVFTKETVLVGWNLKNFFTLAQYLRKKPFQVACQVFDLKLLEAYLGQRKECPKSLAEALGRLKAVLQDKSWPRIQEVHKKVHLPLLLHTLPAIETHGVLDQERRKVLYPYYEIEGQKNGRLNCSEPYRNCFNPHVITPEQRKVFIPRSRDEFFVYFDYEHMEVSMLQWLSKDEKLGELLERPDDVYALIWEAITGQNDRDMGKKLVLPVIYGESPAALAKDWGIQYEQAQTLINRLQRLFQTAFGWLGREFPDGVAEDHFGRRRTFDDKLYRIRNFLVQSPAALVCQEKLIDLDKAVRGLTKVAFHIHDGFVTTATTVTWKEVVRKGVEALESPSTFCPGLKLTVNCKAGRYLENLSVLRRAKGRSKNP